MEFEGYIFDMDGTLVDTMPAHYLSWRKITQKHGLEFSEDRFYSLGGVPTERIFSILAEEQGKTINAAECAHEKENAFVDLISEVQPIEPVLEVVRLNHGKVPMAVATGAMRWVMERILNQLEIADYFQAFVCSEDTTRHKPFPDVFLEAAMRLGVAPEKCCVYEDAQLGIEAGQAAGMHVVDVREFHTPRRITAGAQLLLESMLTNIYHYKIDVVTDDIDVQGHVNNLVYLKWMQDAAVAHSLEKGWGHDEYGKLGCSWVVRAHQIEYRYPAFENDQLEVVTWVDSFRRASCVRKYEIRRKSDDKILAVAQTNWAFVDLEKRMPARVPPEVIEAFKSDPLAQTSQVFPGKTPARRLQPAFSDFCGQFLESKLRGSYTQGQVLFSPFPLEIAGADRQPH